MDIDDDFGSLLDSTSEEEKIVLPSQMKQKKRRVSKTPREKFSAFDINGDDFYTGMPPSPNARTLSPPRDKTLTMEKSLVSYVEQSLKELSDSFLDEFTYSVEKAFSLDPIVNKFVSDVKSDVNNIVKEEFVRSSMSISDKSLESMLTNQVNEQFESLRRLIRPHEKTVDESEPLFASDVDEMKDSIGETLRSSMKELNSEIEPETGNKNDQKQQRKAMHDLKLKGEYLKSYVKMMDLESESIDSRLKMLEERQSAYRQEQIKTMDNCLVLYNEDQTAALTDMIDAIRESMENSNKHIWTDAINTISKETSEISMNLEQTAMRTDYLCKAVARVKKMQWQDVHVAEVSQHEKEPSMISNSSINNDGREQSGILEMVKERLRAIQQERSESMGLQ